MTKIQFFKDCATKDEAKNLFRKLSFLLHPDHNGGKDQDFIKMFQEFKTFTPSNESEQNEPINTEEFYNIVQSFNALINITVSFVGSFIWLEDEEGHKGATYSQRTEIKKILLAGYNSANFAGKKKLWYFSPLGYKQKYGGKKSIEQIKKTYGNKTFKPSGRVSIATA